MNALLHIHQSVLTIYSKLEHLKNVTIIFHPTTELI